KVVERNRSDGFSPIPATLTSLELAVYCLTIAVIRSQVRYSVGRAVGHRPNSDFHVPAENSLRHAVTFYQGEDFPAWRIPHYLWKGLEVGEPALVLATPKHSAQIRECLVACDLQVEHLEASGKLVYIDAQATLRQLTRQGKFRTEAAFTL